MLYQIGIIEIQLGNEEEILTNTKPFIIPKQLVMKSFQLVKANAGSAGIDQQSLASFEKSRKDNLFKIWNRMSSGSYFPLPVKAIPIPKRAGGERILGIPTVSDRIAQMVVKLVFEPMVEPYFHKDSYGYRPHKSALDAVEVTRQRCWDNAWVVEFDIQGLFDNIDHTLLMKAVRRHTDNTWVILYIERWLKSPIQMPDGTLFERTKGTPQGGVISPVLSNLFLHYVFDAWMCRHHPKVAWCRYADDGLVHCQTERQAKQLLSELDERFKTCGLALHPKKTRIIYCKDDFRRGQYKDIKFDFLGYTFCRRTVKSTKRNCLFVRFVPAVSQEAKKSMRGYTRQQGLRNRTETSLTQIARSYNPILRGWIEYYGRYYRSALYSVFRHFNMSLVAWARHKYKRLKGSKAAAAKFLVAISQKQPGLFAHWKIGMIGGFI